MTRSENINVRRSENYTISYAWTVMESTGNPLSAITQLLAPTAELYVPPFTLSTGSMTRLRYEFLSLVFD